MAVMQAVSIGMRITVSVIVIGISAVTSTCIKPIVKLLALALAKTQKYIEPYW